MLENEVLRNLHTRRSCRAYRPEQIKEEELETVLDAGTWAPTGQGLQSPVIIAVQDPATIRELSRMNAAIMGVDKDPFYGAPTVLVVLADTRVRTCVEDGSLVLGAMMEAAASIGLGSCWIHRAHEMFDSEEGKALLEKWGVPNAAYLRGVGNCILGYPAEGGVREPKPRKLDYIIRVK